MISGMYLGETARLIIAECACSKLLFNGRISTELKTPGRFYTKYISEIEGCVLHVFYPPAGDGVLPKTGDAEPEDPGKPG